MRNKVSIFVAGMVTTAAVMSLAVPALAAQGYQITVSPISIMVDGKKFEPKDVNGKNVDVFVYNGTTYAPLRALAEAYGLQVGYDANAKVATVGKAGSTSGSTGGSTGGGTGAPADNSQMYSKFPDVPNFGTMANLQPIEVKDHGDAYTYIYDASSVRDKMSELFKNYCDAMEKAGFRNVGEYFEERGGSRSFSKDNRSVTISYTNSDCHMDVNIVTIPQ